MKNEEVAKQWANHKPARTSMMGNTARFSTNGQDLYSYNLLIGFTTTKGEKVALQYQACAKYSRGDDGWFRSNTTSHHVAIAMRNADITAMPDEVNQYDRLS